MATDPTAELRAEVDRLVDAARNGDRAAFDELVRRTYVDTYTLAMRLTANEEDARDVVQESYLRAWKGIKRFRGDAQFSTWMYRITANAAAALPPKLRSAVVLKDVYGLSHEAIAEDLGISVAAAKVRLHRGRKRLRDVLFEEGGRSAHAV